MKTEKQETKVEEDESDVVVKTKKSNPILNWVGGGLIAIVTIAPLITSGFFLGTRYQESQQTVDTPDTIEREARDISEVVYKAVKEELEDKKDPEFHTWNKLTFLPARFKTNDPLLYLAKPNPLYSLGKSGQLVHIENRTPTIDADYYGDYDDFKIIRTREIVDHLLENKLDKAKISTPNSKSIEHLVIDWDHEFKLIYETNQIVEGKKATILTIESPDKTREVAYVDIENTGIINRIWLYDDYFKGNPDEKVIDLDLQRNVRMQRQVTNEYNNLLDKIKKKPDDE
ncbi:hypothetical protein GOV12_00670 [Candidatus Pacearchaeota archaeon]|nr:hypothetical protein [Candidatus Pacearchaeota archaeon]